MQRPPKPSAYSFVVLTALIAVGISCPAEARKSVDIMTGAYSISAKTDRSSGSFSGPGIYRVAYRQGFGDRFEFTAGYSILFSSVISGDMSYGPDIGALVYPFSAAGPVTAETPNVKFHAVETIRPFASFSFHQRQFRSVEASYAGFSVGAGASFEVGENLTMRAEFRQLVLSGPNKAEATSSEAFVGVSFPF